MMTLLQTVAWIACVVYSTIPAFWLLIHPRVEFWRSRRRSPYRILLPIWLGMWALVATVTAAWRGDLALRRIDWAWIPAVRILFCCWFAALQDSRKANLL
jgi:hypothetical protein